MTKATFTGYFPKLKAHREATVKSGKAINPKGSIRYQIKGECMDDEKGLCISLPKMVTREDFENVYGFDAKEAESAIILGDDKEGNPVGYIHVVGYEDKRGVTPTEIHTGTSELSPKEMVKALGGIEGDFDDKEADTVGNPSPADVEPPAPSEKPFPQEPSNENFSAEIDSDIELKLHPDVNMWDEDGEGLDISEEKEKKIIEDFRDEMDEEVAERINDEDYELDLDEEDYEKYGGADGNFIIDVEAVVPEVKEAFGLFGDKDEEEAEPEEPKTQEFTVVLQEGDKLELTDVEETADTKDEDEGADEENEEKASDCDDHFYEAVQAKVTRPVKEEEEKEEVKDDEEGSVALGTIATVGAVGLGALAIGSMLAAEDEGELDYWDGENAEWRAEGEGEVDFGTQTPKRQIDAWIRHDHNWADYKWRTDGDLSEDETYTVKELVEETIVEDDDEDRDEGPYESTFTYNDDSGKDRDVDIEWHKWRDDGRYYGRAAEGEDFQKMTPSEFVPFDQMQEELGQMWDETTAPLADAHNYDYEPSNEPSNANFSAEGDGLKAFSKKIENEKKKLIKKAKRSGFYENFGDKEGRKLQDSIPNVDYYQRQKYEEMVKDFRNWADSIDLRDLEYQSETVGSPSPSGPSSVPEPAEATGSEPSNAHMEADSKTKNMVIGLTLAGIGLSAYLGKDRINKWFDRFGL